MDNRNATPSWSGFIHQGKVGLIVALEEINSLIQQIPVNNIPSRLEGWEIIYENAEDFDIRQNINNSLSIKSRHQVKATSKTTIKMSDGLFVGVFKGVSDKQKKKFQSVIDQVDSFDFNNIKISITNIQKLRVGTFEALSKFDGNISTQENQKLKNQLVKIKDQMESKKKKNYDCLPNDKNYLHITCKITDYCNNSDKNKNQIKLWDYSGADYCEQSKSKSLICTEICKILNSQTVQENLDALLQQKLTEKILLAHQNKSNQVAFSFNEIYNLLKENDIHYLGVCDFKNNFHDSYLQCCNENPKLHSILDEIINEILHVDTDRFYQFIKGVFPNKTRLPDTFSSTTEVSSFYEDSAIRNIFIEAISTVKKIFDSSNGYVATGENILTAISENDNDTKKNTMIVNINKNLSKLPYNHFEGICLINANIDDTIPANKVLSYPHTTEDKSEIEELNTKIDSIKTFRFKTVKFFQNEP